MTLTKLMIDGGKGSLIKPVFFSLLAGAFHIGLLVLINAVLARLISAQPADLSGFTGALALLFGYLVFTRLAIGATAKFCLTAVDSFRMRLVRAALTGSYAEMNQQQSRLYSAVTKDIVTFSQSIMAATQFVISGLVVCGSLVYLATLSIGVFLLISSAIGLSTAIYLVFSHSSADDIERARDSEEQLFKHTRQLIDGFKEIALNRDKGRDLVEKALRSASADSVRQSYRGFSGFFNLSAVGQLLFYGVILLLLFVGRPGLGLSIAEQVSCIVVTLFIVGPIESLTALIPKLFEGNVAANRLSHILSAFEKTAITDTAASLPLPFETLRYREYGYRYDDGVERGFEVAITDFELKKGEVTFIYGGNGAGKTTLIYLLLGLLKQQSGSVALNGRPLTEPLINHNLFCSVFSDFHLFDRFYGLNHIEPEQVKRLLQRFELDGKVTFDKDRFSSVSLSTGQRKRLALIAALLEQRPILVLDEWAADQDPAFRHTFYNQIVPWLKQQGFTVLAVTHDDKYYRCADRLYRMEDGRLTAVNANQ